MAFFFSSSWQSTKMTMAPGIRQRFPTTSSPPPRQVFNRRVYSSPIPFWLPLSSSGENENIKASKGVSSAVMGLWGLREPRDQTVPTVMPSTHSAFQLLSGPEKQDPGCHSLWCSAHDKQSMEEYIWARIRRMLSLSSFSTL